VRAAPRTAAALLVTVSALANVACREAALEYNVVLISSDTLRSDRLNCYGYAERRVSPHIDALARDGILFRRHNTVSPWTTPSHVSLLTSLYPSTHGVIDTFGRLRAADHEFTRLPDRRRTLAEVLADEGLTTAAFTGGITLDPAIGFDQGFSRYSTSLYKLNDVNQREVLDWLRRRADRRFFLFLHDFETHAPYLRTDLLPDSSAEVKEAYDEAAKRLGDLDVASPDRHVRVSAYAAQILVEHGAFNRDVVSALYDGGVLSVDAWLGRVVATLRDLGIYDRTLIVFTSDHGEELAERSDRFWDHHGHSVHKEVVRVPLIVKLPHQEHAGTVVEAVTNTVHVMPTILDVLGVEPGEHEMQGRSLRPLWEGTDSGEDWVSFTEATTTDRELKAVRSRRYKYIVSIDPELVREHGRSYVPEEPSSRMLFDMQLDPLAQHNLLDVAGHPEAATTAAELDQVLRSFVAETRGASEKVRLDDEAVRRLRALGYVD
jgi:arylsulfatase A-like enzyme